MTLLLILPLIAAFAYVSLVGLMYFSQRALLYPGASATLAPAHPSWGENVSISTPDGETLHGLYAEGVSGKPSVLFFPGNADSATTASSPRRWTRRALACLRFPTAVIRDRPARRARRGC